MKVKFLKIREDAIVPKYATSGAACFDFYANFDGQIKSYFLDEDSPLIVPTGIAVEIPINHVMLIYGRSGHAFKDDVRLSNCVGVIDSDFRGEIKVKLCKDNSKSFFVQNGDRIAQGLIVPIQKIEFVETENLSITDRAENGFGSTGN